MSFTESLVHLYRCFRQFGYRVLGPADYLARVVNGKQHLPPIHLRRHVGPLSSFESSGAEFMAYLRLLGELRPDERVLDLGCGCGQLALQLVDYLDPTGSYCGLDLHGPSIRWCRRHISAAQPNFTFQYADLHSRAYNRRGRASADNYTFPFESESFNLVVAKSVFTHLLPAAADNYCKEISRVLSSNGRCLMTFFLLNEERRAAQRGEQREGQRGEPRERTVNQRPQLNFRFGDSQCRYVHQSSPESAVAYDEAYVRGLLRKHGLALKGPIIYGRWSGNQDGLSFQDILLIERERGEQGIN